MIRVEREEQERRVLEEFYKPSSGASGQSKRTKKKGKEPNKELERVGELDEEPSNENDVSNANLENGAVPKEDNVEVLNFEELMSNDEEQYPLMEGDENYNINGGAVGVIRGQELEYYEGENQGNPHARRFQHELNEIAEEDAANEDVNSPHHPSRLDLSNKHNKS